MHQFTTSCREGMETLESHRTAGGPLNDVYDVYDVTDKRKSKIILKTNK